MRTNYKNFILLFFLSLCISLSWAQQPNYTLKTNESGATKQYQAFDFVSLKPGFRYTAVSGQSFNAKIQTGIPPLPTSNTYALPDGTITTNPAEGGIVGSIPGRFNVSGGAATYSIPIECPAGINGKQPNISLEYSSRGGNGPLGIGWNIGGLSSITRTGMNLFSDNNFSGINIDDELYQLDGNRLIVINSVIPEEYNITVNGNPNTTLAGHLNEWNTTPGSTFVTENNTYSKIEAFGSIPYIWFDTPANYTQWISKSTGPRYFKISTKAGEIIEYTAARNPDYITEDNGETVNMEWVITKITDVNGNYMSISYNSYGGQTVIKQIDYTGNSTNNSLPFMSVIFNYEEKNQIESFYISNATFNDHFLLKNIQIKSNNTTIIQQYDLTYVVRNEKYYLENISLKGRDNIKLNSTVFEWGVNNEVININTVNTPEPYSQQQVIKSDRYWLDINANGDGIDDVVNFYPAKIADQNGVLQTKNYAQIFNTSLNNGQISFSNNSYYDIGDFFSYDDIKSPNPSVLTGDISGDGKDELIIPQLSITNNNIMQFKIAGGNTLERSMNSGIMPVYNIADINNDGIDEIIYIEKVKIGNEYNGAICYTLANNSKSWVSIQFSISEVPQKIICSDFNSDGLIDLMILTDTRYYIYENEGSNKNAIVYPTAKFNKITAKSDSLNLNNGLSMIKKGDFNGDGSVDFIINGHCNSNWSLAINDGNFGFDYTSINNITAIEEGFTSNNNNKEDCIVTDFNRDGKSDIIIVDPVYNSSGVFTQTNITWYASSGSSFVVVKSFTTYDESYTFNKFNCTGDFDGDGREDVLSYGSDIYNGSNKSDYVYIQRAFNSNFEGNLIKSITDGMGFKTDINYQPLTYTITPDNKQFYTKGTNSAYPVADIQFPLYCVSKVSEPNGQGGMNTTEFAYTEARAQLTGRGFLGFKTQTISNASSNRKVVSTTDIDLTYCLPSKLTTEVSTVNGTPLSKTETTFGNTKTGSVYESKKLKTENWDYLTTLTGKTEYIDYDDYGNPTNIKTTQGNVISTQEISYVQRGSWCDNKPENVTLTRTQGTDVNTRTTEYTYDTKGNLTKVINDVGDVNHRTTEYKEWTNVYGIPTRTEVTANGITRSNTITLNSSGRYIDSKTDVLGQTTNYSWDAVTGLLNSETNRLGTTSYSYNGLGQLTRTDYADGTYTENAVQWASPDNAFGARFYVYQGSSGSAPVYTWFDGLQREIVKEAYRLKGNKSRVFTQYSTDGKVDKVSAPTFGSEPTAWDAVYAYYTDGRLNTVTTPLGTTTTTYSGNSTTVTTPEGSQTTTLNDAGQVATSMVNGKTVTYDYYPSGLAKTITPQNGQVISMVYDLQGNRTKLTDPDTGETLAQYTGFGELDWEKITNNNTQGVIITDYSYESATGLLETRTRNGETTRYGYDPQKRLETIEIAGQHKQTYGYGDYDRVSSLTELINGTKTLVKSISYDGLGRVSSETFPSLYYVEYHYDDYGNLYQITDSHTPARVIWEATEANARGQITRELKGAKETVYGYDNNKGQLTSMVASGVVNYGYSYDATNNLVYRSDNLIGQKEHFTYNTQNQLTNWDILNSTNNAVLKQNSITYDGTTGNITAKSDLNVSTAVTLNYEEPLKPHRLTSISGNPDAIPDDNLTVTYTDFRKIKMLNENGKNYIISYGVDDQRRKSEYTMNGNTTTRYYFGNYEEEITGTNVRKIHYLSGGAVLINNNGVETLYYGYTDNQGSLIALTTENGTVVEKYAYDPWGVRLNPTNWIQTDNRTGWITNRGYTGHEHIDAFGIINMNGRVYDPATAMFFSPDPFVQSPGNWSNYNRYSYVSNNPTKFTDPSGYIQANIEMPWFDPSWSRIMNAYGGGGGRNATFAAWDAQHKGSISYGGNGNYFYANGDKASTADAMRNQKIDVAATLALGFQIAKLQGWTGNYDDFTNLYNQRTASSSYNGTFTIHTYESFFVPLGTGAKATGEINILLESGLVSNREILSVASTTAGALGMYASGIEYGWKYLSNASKNNTVYQISQALKNTGIKVNPNAIKAGLPKIFKVSGNIVGGLGIGVTALQYVNHDITGVEAGVDVAFGIIGFMGPIGAGISATYFLGKIGYEYFSGNSLFEKPQ